MTRTLLYIGTYTRPAPYIASSNGKGIYVYELNQDTGEITYLSEIEGIDSPGFITIDQSKRYLYATSEVWGWQEGTLSAYAIDPATGALSYINKQPTLGSITAYASVDKTNRYVLVANYWAGKSAVVFPRRDDGGLAPARFSVEHSEPGAGVDPARQDKSHAHCIQTDPNNRFVLIADLGIDKIMVYQLNAETGALVPNDPPFVKLSPGAGPRHFVFHPNGKFVYVIQELSSSISALTFDGASGKMEVIQTVPTLPDGVDHDSSHCSDIQITKSGKFLYGANRGHDSLVIYAVDENTGRLTYVGHQSTGGKIPRNFAIDPSDTFVLAANQDSDTIVTFRINQQTGELQDTGNVAQVPTPVCLKMIVV